MSLVKEVVDQLLDQHGDSAVSDPDLQPSFHFIRGQAVHFLLDSMVTSLRSQDDLACSLQRMVTYKTTLETDVAHACDDEGLKPDALRMRANSALHAYENPVVRAKLGHDPEYLDQFIDDLKEACRLRLEASSDAAECVPSPTLLS
jgi:hypothetical protein